MMTQKLLKWVQFVRAITPSVSPRDHTNDPFYQAAVLLNTSLEKEHGSPCSSELQRAAQPQPSNKQSCFSSSLVLWPINSTHIHRREKIDGQTCWSSGWNINVLRVSGEMRWGRVGIWRLASNWQTHAVPQRANSEWNDQRERAAVQRHTGNTQMHINV